MGVKKEGMELQQAYWRSDLHFVHTSTWAAPVMNKLEECMLVWNCDWTRKLPILFRDSSPAIQGAYNTHLARSRLLRISYPKILSPETSLSKHIPLPHAWEAACTLG